MALHAAWRGASHVRPTLSADQLAWIQSAESLIAQYIALAKLESMASLYRTGEVDKITISLHRPYRSASGSISIVASASAKDK